LTAALSVTVVTPGLTQNPANADKVDIIDSSRRFRFKNLRVCNAARRISAHKSGCHQLLLSIPSKANKASCEAGLTRLLGQAATGMRKLESASAVFGGNDPLTNHSSAQEQSRNNVTTRSLSRPISTTKPSSLYCLSWVPEAVPDRLSQGTAKVGLRAMVR
jgi:hypothetical protein